jgi:hypothetical protein
MGVADRFRRARIRNQLDLDFGGVTTNQGKSL